VPRAVPLASYFPVASPIPFLYITGFVEEARLRMFDAPSHVLNLEPVARVKGCAGGEERLPGSSAMK
jgi:hypothetical protein